jgi:hypothetical protein
MDFNMDRIILELSQGLRVRSFAAE